MFNHKSGALCKSSDFVRISGTNEVEFSEYCYYTYKYPSTEAADLGQQVITVNVGLMEAIGNSFGKVAPLKEQHDKRGLLGGFASLFAV